MVLLVECRDRSGHDVCNKPGDGHVLGNITLECHGNHGDCPPPIPPGQCSPNVDMLTGVFLSFASGSILGRTPVQSDTPCVRAGRVSLLPEG